MTPAFDNRGRNFKWILYIVDVIILTLVFAIFANWIVEVVGWRNYDSDSRFYWNRYGYLLVFLLSIKHRSANVVKAIFVGADDNNVSLYKEIKHGFSTYGYNVLGFFSSFFQDNVPAYSRYLGNAVGYENHS